jgi:hypothetical protein
MKNGLIFTIRELVSEDVILRVFSSKHVFMLPTVLMEATKCYGIGIYLIVSSQERIKICSICEVCWTLVFIDIVTCCLKAGILESEYMALARQRLR